VDSPEHSEDRRAPRGAECLICLFAFASYSEGTRSARRFSY
jgi:hypothetical protein